MARRKYISNIPSYDELIVPTVKALIRLGGSGTIGLHGAELISKSLDYLKILRVEYGRCLNQILI